MIYEGNETFHFILSSPSNNATISDATGVVTITDDDTAPSIIAGDIGVEEGGVDAFPVSLSNPSSQTITVQYFYS